jgi:salicylate hydroxylase
MTIAGQKITVIGAGVGGLAAAVALAHKGALVTVLEQADAIREIGAGLQVSPNGAAVLKGLGLGEALRAKAMAAQAVELRDGYDGDTILRLDLAALRPDQGYYFVHRADLIAILHEAALAAGVKIELLTKVDSVDLSGALPRLVTSTGEELAPQMVIGADGLHSATRKALNGAQAARFTQQVAWRCTIPAQGNDPAVAEAHLGAGRHLVSYPLRGGTLRNIVAVEERKNWVEESWALRDDPMELRLAFESFGPRVHGWLEQAQDVYLWGLFRHPVAQVWGKAMAEGAAALLGDAAHPTLPFLAQGASMALEDAWVLADLLARHSDVAVALQAYQAARAPRCRRIVDAATGNARAFHLSGATRAVAHAGLRIGGRLAPQLALKRFDWLYGFDVTKG